MFKKNSPCNFRKIFVLLLCFLFLSAQTFAQDSAGGAGGDNLAKDVVLMAVYGTLSGLVIGTASVAFSDRPFSTTTFRRMAIGASLGLYLGLLLGALIAVDRSLGAGGGGDSLFDVEEEEIPLVYYKKDKFKLSMPSIYVASVRDLRVPNKMKDQKETLEFKASIFKMKF